MKKLALLIAALFVGSIFLAGCSAGEATPADAQDQVKLREEYKKANPDDKSY